MEIIYDCPHKLCRHGARYRGSNGVGITLGTAAAEIDGEDNGPGGAVAEAGVDGPQRAPSLHGPDAATGYGYGAAAEDLQLAPPVRSVEDRACGHAVVCGCLQAEDLAPEESLPAPGLPAVAVPMLTVAPVDLLGTSVDPAALPVTPTPVRACTPPGHAPACACSTLQPLIQLDEPNDAVLITEETHLGLFGSLLDGLLPDPGPLAGPTTNPGPVSGPTALPTGSAHSAQAHLDGAHQDLVPRMCQESQLCSFLSAFTVSPPPSLLPTPTQSTPIATVRPASRPPPLSGAPAGQPDSRRSGRLASKLTSGLPSMEKAQLILLKRTGQIQPDATPFEMDIERYKQLYHKPLTEDFMNAVMALVSATGKKGKCNQTPPPAASTGSATAQ